MRSAMIANMLRLCLPFVLLAMFSGCFPCPVDDTLPPSLQLQIIDSNASYKLQDVKLYWMEDGAKHYDQVYVDYLTTGYDTVKKQQIVDSSKTYLSFQSSVGVAVSGKTRTFYLDYDGKGKDTLDLYVRVITEGKRCPSTRTVIDSVVRKGLKLPVSTDFAIYGDVFRLVRCRLPPWRWVQG